LDRVRGGNHSMSRAASLCSRVALLLASALQVGCDDLTRGAGGVEYSLYRTGIDLATQGHDETLRIHVATFDATPFKSDDDNAKYNLANCGFSEEAFLANQPHFRDYQSNSVAKGSMKLKYWCEKGRFIK